MNKTKVLLAVAIVATATSANATVYIITGAETAVVNSAGAAIVLVPSNTPWISQTIGSAQIGAITNAVTGSLDITGTTINSGSLSEAAGGQYTFLGDYFGTTMNTSAATITFAGNSWSSTASVVAGTCSGAAAPVVCPVVYAGYTPLDYVLSSTGVNTWKLDLRSESDTFQITQTYALTAAVPIPATAWLFGSALLGLAGARRRRK